MLTHAYAVEFIEAIIALGVLAIIIMGTWRAFGDLVRVRREVDDPRIDLFAPDASLVATHGVLERQWYRMMLAGVFLYIAGRGVWLEPPCCPGHFWDGNQMSQMHVAFIIAMCVHAGASLTDLRTRRRIERALLQDQERRR